ncbi:MAG: MBL fold metallo-hydrolase [Clostridia bacterium]|nr:MBL fold metallo-hydrolase [Clostridia bacterium]
MKIISIPCGILKANMHLVYKESGQAIVIDPIDSNVLSQLIQSHKLTICALFLTHAHYDHIVDLEKIRSMTNAPSYIVSHDNPLLSDPFKNVSAWISYPTTYQSCDHLLSHEDTVETSDFSVKVLHTPGHTPGSACFLVEDALFTGDTVMSDGIGRCDLYGGNINQMLTSLQLFNTLPSSTRVYPGHGNNTTISAIQSMIRYYTK